MKNPLIKALRPTDTRLRLSCLGTTGGWDVLVTRDGERKVIGFTLNLDRRAKILKLIEESYS